jgi:hypothetical protein
MGKNFRKSWPPGAHHVSNHYHSTAMKWKVAYVNKRSRPPAYTKKATELASVQSGDSASKEQPSTQAVASITTEPDRM